MPIIYINYIIAFKLDILYFILNISKELIIKYSCLKVHESVGIFIKCYYCYNILITLNILVNI